MDLQEFKTAAQKEIFTRYQNSEEIERFVIYKAMAHRWEDEESADPIINDEEYFLTEEEAIKYANGLKLEIGFTPTVDRLFISEVDLEEKFKDEDFELSDVADDAETDETIYSGKTNEGEDLEGAVIVVWNWEKYVGYARNFERVRYGESGETDNSINTGNLERTFRGNQSVLLEAKEIEGLEGEELLEAVNEALSAGNYKWNYFKNHPTDEKIIHGLGIEIAADDE